MLNIKQTETQRLITKIRENGLSRAEIARQLNTSWSLVDKWSKGFWNSSPSNLIKLKQLAGEK